MRDPGLLGAALRAEQRRLALGGGVGLVTALATVGLMTVGGSLLASTAVTGLAAAGSWSPLVGRLGAAIRLLAILRTVGRYGERLLTHDATFRVLARLRQAFFERLAPLAPARLQALRSGDLLDRLVADVDALGSLYVRVLAPYAWSLATVALVTVALALLDPTLALAGGALLALAVVGLPSLGQVLAARTGAEVAEDARRLRVRLLEALQGRLELQVYGAAEAAQRALSDAGLRLLRRQARYARRVAAVQALGVLVAGAGILAALVAGTRAVGRGGLAPEQLAAAVLALWTAFEVVGPVALAFPERGRARAAEERLRGVLEAAPATPAPATPALPPAPGACGLRLEGVSLRYPGAAREALSGVDLHVPAGARLAVLGPSGAGKSSLAALILRLWDPGEGRVTLGGVDLRDLSDPALRRLVTGVPQRPHLFGGTLRENLRLARPEASDGALLEALDVACLAEEVATWPEGLGTWLRGSGDALQAATGPEGEPAGEGRATGAGARAAALGRPLSGGQARRVALARAVLRDAAVVVLDEPTADLDPDTGVRLLGRLLRAFGGRTVIVITHDPRVAAHLDRVVVVAGGRVASERLVA